MMVLWNPGFPVALSELEAGKLVGAGNVNISENKLEVRK
jgi:hypothetical protein